MLVEESKEKHLLLAAGEDASVADNQFMSDYHSDGCDNDIYDSYESAHPGECRHKI